MSYPVFDETEASTPQPRRALHRQTKSQFSVTQPLKAVRHSTRFDRYGWEHKSDVEYVPEEELRLRRMESQDEFIFETEWRNVIAKWPSSSPKQVDVLINKGIPDCYRSSVWFLLSDPPPLSERPTIEYLINQPEQPCWKVIDADLPRTFAQVVVFQNPEIMESLRKILRAYSVYDRELGYFQGMSFYAAMLLNYMNETDAFWTFVSQMKRTRSMFLHEFRGLHQMNSMWTDLFESQYKQISTHFRKLQIVPEFYTGSWFLTAFINIDFPPVLRLRLFDRFIRYGKRALLAFGLAIISRHKVELHSMDLNEILMILQNPDKSPNMQDWRYALKKMDQKMPTQKAYSTLLHKLGIPQDF